MASRRKGQSASIGAVLLALGILAWVGWIGTETRGEMRAAEHQAVRVAELRGTLAYLDEWLTMSANMAALTREARWTSRYEEASPDLAAAIAEAIPSRHRTSAQHSRGPPRRPGMA